MLELSVIMLSTTIKSIMLNVTALIKHVEGRLWPYSQTLDLAGANTLAYISGDQDKTSFVTRAPVF